MSSTPTTLGNLTTVSSLQALSGNSSASITFPNATESSMVYIYTPISYTSKTTIAFFLGLFGVFGLIGNSVVLHLERKKRKKVAPTGQRAFERSVTLYFIRSLALTDLLCATINVPFSLIYVFEDIFKSKWDCVTWHFPLFGLPCITITNLTVIAIERYLAVFYPFSAPSRAFSKKLVIAAWIGGGILGIILTLPIDNRYQVVNEHIYTYTCVSGHDKAWEKAVFSVIMALIYFVPNIIMIFCAISISRFLRKRKRQITTGNLVYVHSSQAWRFKDTQMFMNIIFAFAIPYAFFFVYGVVKRLANLVQLDYEQDYIVRIVTAILGYSNSALNPVIYFASWRNLRKDLIQMFSQNVATTASDVETRPSAYQNNEVSEVLNSIPLGSSDSGP